MLPADLLLDKASQQYGVRTLHDNDDHQCKTRLLKALKRGVPLRKGRGIQRNATLLLPIIQDADLLLEDSRDVNKSSLLPSPIIGVREEQEAKKHHAWIEGLPKDRILMYTDGSTVTDSTVAAAWHCVQTKREGNIT
ncbi:hypothetical protein Q9L58_010300, partial [Maublancomyces gigas]